MRIIIAPAKQMVEDNDTFLPEALPVFLAETEKIAAFLKTLSYGEAKALWGCNDKLTEQNLERIARMDLKKGLTPAILAYDGIAFKYMAPGVFEDGQFQYVQDHLRILSGFYGVLKPMDGVAPYRLEMQAKAKVDESKDLYDFWGDKLYKEVMKENEDRILVNLASKEYSRCVEKYLAGEDRFVTCIFGELEKKKVVQKGVYAKMGRGEMVRYMAETGALVPEDLKSFDRLNYSFAPEYSDRDNYVFLR